MNMKLHLLIWWHQYRCFNIFFNGTFFTSQETLDNLSFNVHSNHICDIHMKMSCVIFDLVVLPLSLPPWSTLFFSFMSPHYGSSSHNLCNVYYFVFLLMFFIWYYVVVTMHSLLLHSHAFFTQHCHLLMLL